MIKELQLKNYRSYPELNLEFEAGWTVFAGANGAGKTNLLEAIFFMVMLRSFRTAQPKEMIRHNENAFSLYGRIERGVWQERLQLSYAGNGDRYLERNGSAVRKSSNFIGLTLPVAFIPEDIMLISGSGSIRRRFADMYLSLLDPQYQHSLYNYNSALLQRNAALKRGQIAKAAAGAFEPIMAEHAIYIEKRRRNFAALLADEVCLLLNNEPENEFSIVYRPDCPVDSIAEYRSKLAEDRAKDLKRGCTQSGPQLDDFVFNLHGQPMRNFASMGQRRKLAIYLKLAAYTIMRKQIKSTKTGIVVLVDDVTGELDAANKQRFFESIKTADQAFFTFTEPPADAVFQTAGQYKIIDSKAICVRR